MRTIDIVIVILYMAAMAAIGLRFARSSQKSTEAYFLAGRSIPSWAIGMSMMATLVSSVTFIAYPGSSYGGNWSNLVPGFFLIAMLALAGPVLIPFYRQAVRMSAYEYFGKRFGPGAQVYSSIAFSLGHFGKMGFVYYLVALTVNSMTGWSLDGVIVAIGIVTIFYTVIGGIEAVIWTDVVQGFIMWIGIFVCLGFLLFLPPGGPEAVFRIAADNNKFSLGSMDFDLARKTIPVLSIYGFFWYLQKYSADQTIVQRYLVAKSDRGALRGVAFGALQTVPLWALFMLIGTCTWAFYQLTGIALPAHIQKADQVFPHFLATQLPAGATGLFMASLMAAAMSTLASDLNCIAVVSMEDVYRRLRPLASDEQKLRAGKWLVVVFGVLGIGMAEILAHSAGAALNLWFSLSAILSGGLAGLFLLAFATRRANRRGVYAGIVVSIVFTAWATLTSGNARLINMPGWNYPWDDLTIGAAGHAVLFVVGYFASLMFGSRGEAPTQDVTIWRWLVQKRASAQAVSAP